MTWNIQRWPLQRRRWGYKCPCPQVCPFTSQKSSFIPNWPFHFPHVSFCFPEVPPFYFSKMFYCFPELPFSFPETPSFYLLWASFSKNAFFPAACTFLPSSGLPTKMIFVSLLFCVLLELFIDQLVTFYW